jgi:site-specific DNA-methyltransferase (adenine-specific)
MFSFVGDTVLDPFLGTGTTTRAAMLAGRNSIGVEVEPIYFDLTCRKLAARPFGVEITHERAPYRQAVGQEVGAAE